MLLNQSLILKDNLAIKMTDRKNCAFVEDVDGSITELVDPKIKIVFEGTQSNIVIKRPYKIRGGASLVIHVGSNCSIEISRGLQILEKLSINLKNKNKCYIGENFHVHSLSIFGWGEPNLTIKIGANCLFSSNISIRTSDGHAIYSIDNPNVPLNKPEFGVEIGDHVWCGSKVDILKDVKIGNDSIIGTRSLVTRGSYLPNVVLAGIPAKIVRKGVNWDKHLTHIFGK